MSRPADRDGAGQTRGVSGYGGLRAPDSGESYVTISVERRHMAAEKRLGSTPRHFRAGSRVFSLPGPASTAAPLPCCSPVRLRPWRAFLGNLTVFWVGLHVVGPRSTCLSLARASPGRGRSLTRDLKGAVNWSEKRDLKEPYTLEWVLICLASPTWKLEDGYFCYWLTVLGADRGCWRLVVNLF